MANSELSFYIELYTDSYKDGIFSLEYLKEKLALLESVEHKWVNHRNHRSYYASVDALKIVISRIKAMHLLERIRNEQDCNKKEISNENETI